MMEDIKQKVIKYKTKVNFWLFLFIWILGTRNGLSISDLQHRAQSGTFLISTVNCISHDTKYTCDCHNSNERMKLPRLDGFVFHIYIQNCNSLTIEANTLEATRGLRKITIKNINRLIIKQHGLHFRSTPSVIEFEKVNFEIIESHAIKGNIESISFKHGSIRNIHAFGFTTCEERALLFHMDYVLLKQIDSQAFKKFAVDDMDITNCIFEQNIPSKAFYELEVFNSLHLSSNIFRAIHSHAFSFRIISKLFIMNNIFQSVDAEWFEARVLETILIGNNNFGMTSPIAFKGFIAHRDYLLQEQMEFSFRNNSLHYPPDTLQPLEFSPRVILSLKHLNFDNSFTCDLVDFTQKPPVPKLEFFRSYMDNIYFLPENGFKSMNNRTHVVLSQLIQTHCKKEIFLWVVICLVIGVLSLITIGAFILWIVCANRKKLHKLDLVLPEPRTYKETQIVYKIENAGLMKTDL